MKSVKRAKVFLLNEVFHGASGFVFRVFGRFAVLPALLRGG